MLFRERFQDWDQGTTSIQSSCGEIDWVRIVKMLEYCGDVLEWSVKPHPQRLPSWLYESGRLCLTGALAPALTPYLVQRAAMGIEDAAVLGGLLEVCPEVKILRATLRQ